MRRFIPEICSVECGSREKSVPTFDVFVPKFGEGRHENLFFWGGGICKSTLLLTYWPSLVEIPWLVFHLC